VLISALEALAAEMEKEATVWQKKFKSSANKQLCSLRGATLAKVLQDEKLTVLHRSWSDISRHKNSSVGRNITDMTFSAISPNELRKRKGVKAESDDVGAGVSREEVISDTVDYRDLPAAHFADFAAIRAANFMDEVNISTPTAVQLKVRTPGGDEVETLTLATFLKNIGRYVAELPNDTDWSDPIDTDGSPMQLASQFSLIPLARKAAASAGAAATGTALTDSQRIAHAIGRNRLAKVQQAVRNEPTKISSAIDQLLPRIARVSLEDTQDSKRTLIDVITNGSEGEAPPLLGEPQPVDLSVACYGYQGNNVHIIITSSGSMGLAHEQKHHDQRIFLRDVEDPSELRAMRLIPESRPKVSAHFFKPIPADNDENIADEYDRYARAENFCTHIQIEIIRDTAAKEAMTPEVPEPRCARTMVGAKDLRQLKNTLQVSTDFNVLRIEAHNAVLSAGLQQITWQQQVRLQRSISLPWNRLLTFSLMRYV